MRPWLSTGLAVSAKSSAYAKNLVFQQPAKLSPAQLCDVVDAINKAFNAFPVNTVPYDVTGVLNPNSNSFVRYLTTFAADLGSVSHSARARGWSHSLLGR
jgi:hypothetical protein